MRIEGSAIKKIKLAAILTVRKREAACTGHDLRLIF